MEWYDVAYSFFSAPGTWVLIILLFLGMAGKRVVKTMRRFKKLKLGPVEAEQADYYEKTDTCPHGACRDARNSNAMRMWERIDANKDNIKELIGVIKQLEVAVQENGNAISLVADDLKNMKVEQRKIIFYAAGTMPDEERMYAGLKYVSAGHNHQMRKDVLAFCTERPDMYRAAVRALPSLRVGFIETAIKTKGTK